MIKHKQKVRFDILGKKWKLFTMTARDYKKEWGKDSVAVTETKQRKIYLSPGGVELCTIIHELVHAYVAELCLSSTSMSTDDLEEVFAELMASRGQELLDLATYALSRIEASK